MLSLRIERKELIPFLHSAANMMIEVHPRSLVGRGTCNACNPGNLFIGYCCNLAALFGMIGMGIPPDCYVVRRDGRLSPLCLYNLPELDVGLA